MTTNVNFKNANASMAATILAAAVFALIIIFSFASFGQQSDSKGVKTEQAAKQGKAPKGVRCAAIAKSSGQQCKNLTKNLNGFCRVHQPKEATK